MDVRKDMDSMHPVREELDRYVRGGLDDARNKQVEKHLKDCDFCRELVENLRLQSRSISESLSRELPLNLMEEADKIFDLSLRGSTIELISLESLSKGQSAIMAADGKLRHDRDVENLSNVYSENPEIVLRLMKDNIAGECYVQVVSDDPSLYENMLVELPEIGLSIVTDRSGRGRIDNLEPDKISNMRWQIRMPNAVFELESLTFDPDHSKYRKETILESDQGDSIRLSLEGKGSGKQIELEVLQLDGSTEIGTLQMVVSVDDDVRRFRLEGDNSVVIEAGSLNGKMRIRLYT